MVKMRRKKLFTLIFLTILTFVGFLALLPVQLHSTDCCLYCYDYMNDCITAGGGMYYCLLLATDCIMEYCGGECEEPRM